MLIVRLVLYAHYLQIHKRRSEFLLGSGENRHSESAENRHYTSIEISH